MAEAMAGMLRGVAGDVKRAAATAREGTGALLVVRQLEEGAAVFLGYVCPA